MEFLNDSGVPADLYTGFVEEDVIQAQVVLRATYRLHEGGRLDLSDDQWPIFDEPLKTKLGTFPTDRQPMRAGCDLVVTGTLIRPEPVREATVSLTLDAHHRELRVMGDRIWQKSGDELIPSEPTAFTSMPLIWENAYGGKVEFEGEVGAYPLNMVGKGFYLSMEGAEGMPLPNLELAASPIRKWGDRPTPACWAPVTQPLTWYTMDAIRELNGKVEDDIVERLSANVVMSSCRPDMVLLDVGKESRLSVSGFGPRDRTIDLGQLMTPEVQARFGQEEVFGKVSLGGLWLLLDDGLLVVTYRGAFRGGYRPHETRTARVHNPKNGN